MITQYAHMVDSLSQGTEDDSPGFSVAQGGLGNMVELLAEMLGAIPRLGPLISSGIRGVWINPASNVEWQQTGTWTTVNVATDLFDRAPRSFYANGASNTQIYHVPPQYRRNVGFDFYWTDYPAGGNWSYRIDGGAWTAMGQTVAGNNGLKKFYVATPAASTIEVRAATAAGVACGCLPVGVGLWYVDPRTATQGLVMHNLGVNGQTLNTRMGSVGDKMQFIKGAGAGTGSPITNVPNGGVFQIGLNDVAQVNDLTQWNTDLTALKTYVVTNQGLPLGLMNPYEFPSSFAPFATQTNYRNQTKTTAASLGLPSVLDFYDLLAAKGITGNAAMLANGLLASTVNTHQSQLMHLFMADKMYWWMRSNFFASVIGRSAYPVGGKVAAPTTWGSKLAAPTTYRAALPLRLS